MQFLFTLLSGLPFISFPSPLGWGAWLLLTGLLIANLVRWRKFAPRWKPGLLGVWLGLLVLVPLSSLYIGLRLSAGSALPLPDLPAESPGSTIMLFSAVPWTLAGALLGPIPAALLGGLAGLLRGAWDTHNLFSLLELAFVAALFSISTRQRYRTPVYRLLRQPLIAALVLVPARTIFYIVSAFFTLSASPTARIDYAISNLGVSTLAFAGEMLLAGLVIQITASMFPSAFGRQTELEPSPSERSLETRFITGTTVFLILILLTLLVGDWQVAGRAARNMLRDRMSSTAQAAAQGIPFLLESGQNLIVHIASEPRLLELSEPELSGFLGRQMQSIPYFDQLMLVDVNTQQVIAGYPQEARTAFSLRPDEQAGLTLSAQGVPIQVYALPPGEQEPSARISFLAGIQEAGGITRVLIGRTALVTNPLTQPLLSSLGSMDELGGVGILLDESQRVLYRSSEQTAVSVSEGLVSSQAGIQENTAADGTRQLVYYQPVPGSSWSILLAVPAQETQQIALEIAVPLSILVLMLALAALILLRFGLRTVAGSLTNLSVEANRIAQGQLNHPLELTGADEISQLRRAFEQMRASLQARLDELNRLLNVTRSVSSTLDLERALKPVLEALLSTGASGVRIVLKPGDTSDAADETLLQNFQAGPAAKKYAHLDEEIFQLAREREQILIPSLALSREIPFNLSLSHPAALLAVSLRHENRYYGVLWAAFDEVRSFTDSDVGFAITLAGQAALAVSNAFLFQNVEASRRQLEAILNSTPDPVLVTDHRNRLLLSNRAANRALGLDSTKSTGQPTERVIQQRLLFDLLQSSLQQQQSAEIVLKDKRTYLATASTVKVEGRPVGRVCILRDVTHFKELDTMKSEFVATVSHDLRSPLTLMRGYATMLPMVGELNEQQQSYARKIISGVENMSQLVSNLLDLGRIEVGVGLELGHVAVLDILERVTGSLQQQAEQKKVTLKLELPKDMPHAVQADAALLYQAVYNLVENAIKYTPEAGCVTIGVQSDQQALILEVSDTGIGIPAEDMPRLFEKFFRGSQREARAQHGTGLGLAIVHSIAERHGGRVWVESQPGKGSTFRLLIPLTQRTHTLPPD